MIVKVSTGSNSKLNFFFFAENKIHNNRGLFQQSHKIIKSINEVSVQDIVNQIYESNSLLEKFVHIW